jgi:hypothetical protein
MSGVAAYGNLRWQERPKKCGPVGWRVALGEWIQTMKVENFHKQGVGSDFGEGQVLHET